MNQAESQPASSPYSSGGGGVSFERRVSVLLLAALLREETAPGLYGRKVVEVGFQRAPSEPVDDLVVASQYEDEAEPSHILAVAVRRRPKFTTSDSETKKLLGDFVRSSNAAGDEDKHSMMLVVAGPQKPAAQVAELAAIARASTEAAFYHLVNEPGRFNAAVRGRLSHLTNLVQGALEDLKAEASADAAKTATWKLLSHLTVWQPRLESSDATDWDELANDLGHLTSDHNAQAGLQLRDRLESLAGQYSPQAATVSRSMVLRDVHPLVMPDRLRSTPGWQALDGLQTDCRRPIRSQIGGAKEQDGSQLERRAVRDELVTALHKAEVVYVHGDSGSGKSSITLAALDERKADGQQTLDFVYLNLRQVPPARIVLDSALGTPIVDLLATLSSPTRILVVDGGEFVTETSQTALSWLVAAGQSAGLSIVIVCTTESLAAIKSELPAAEHTLEVKVGGLTDSELDQVTELNPTLRGLLGAKHSKDLLRRPVIADLLARAQVHETIVTETDAMQKVWATLVRRDGKNDRGAPDARDGAMRDLASFELGKITQNELLSNLDWEVVDYLRRDGLLAPASTSPWEQVPRFFHEQIRLYAVSYILLANADPVQELLKVSAPRWSLAAGRLAAQYLLAAENSDRNPSGGRFNRLQEQFDSLVGARLGERWADVPTEAVLPLREGGSLLSESWSSIVDANGFALRRLLRVLQQRHNIGGFIDSAVAERVVRLLLELNYPPALRDSANELVRDWLLALVIQGAEVGNPTRIFLREKVVSQVREADEASRIATEEAAAALAARTPEQIAEEAERTSRFPVLGGPIGFERRRQRRLRRDLPMLLADKWTVTALALLGPDLGESGQALLMRLAQDAPEDLEPAVETLGAPRAIALFSADLLVKLTEAYYIDEDAHPEDDDFGYDREEGIRDHGHRRGFGNFSSAMHGPFLVMLRADFRGGLKVITRMLNHAAICRVKSFRRWDRDHNPLEENTIELSISGSPTSYVGDGQLWNWYRGTGVGPYPCLSALQALELVVDQLIEAGLPLARAAELLMEDCRNLAMPALVVNLLVRHLEQAGSLLDPYLSEPLIWHLEFGRYVQERSGFAAAQSGIHKPDRRPWTLREAALGLTLNATPERQAELEEVADRLEEKARTLVDATNVEELATVAGWAAGLRRSTFTMTQSDDGFYVEPKLPDEVAQVLEAGRAKGDLTAQAYRLVNRYSHDRQGRLLPIDIDSEALADDVEMAKVLLASSGLDTFALGEGAGALAATVLERRIISGDLLDLKVVEWAARLVLEIANEQGKQRPTDAYDYQYFDRGPDVSAASVISLLMLPAAEDIRNTLEVDVPELDDHLLAANTWAATQSSLIARHHWSASLDHLWRADSMQLNGESSHAIALRLIEESARGAALGAWDTKTQSRPEGRFVGTLVDALASTQTSEYVAERLLPGVRALQHFEGSEDVEADAGRLLGHALVGAYLRGRQEDEFGPQHSQTDMVTVTRFALVKAGADNAELALELLESVIDRTDLLDEFMGGIAAAAEEGDELAATATQVWPRLLARALDLMDVGRVPHGDGSMADRGLASLLPTRTYGDGYLLREMQGDAVLWIDVASLEALIVRWLPYALGSRRCLDQLISHLSSLDLDQQVKTGIEAIESIVESDPGAMANRSYTLPDWLRSVQGSARSAGLISTWQRIVDLLLVAGEDRLEGLVD